MRCGFDPCTSGAEVRGFCRKHYDHMRNTGQLEMTVHKSRSIWWEPVAVTANYRLKLEAAKAKVTQALLISSHPDKVFPQTLEEVLMQALEELEVD
jgi:DNA-binding sugar fermentation-stimulating protein